MGRIGKRAGSTKLWIVSFCLLAGCVALISKRFSPIFDESGTKVQVALVAFALGEEENYAQYFKDSHMTYARRHNYDYIIIRDVLDANVTVLDKPKDMYAMQKLLVFSQSWSSNYEYIILVEYDVFITCNAPAVHTATNFGTLVGVANEFSQPTEEIRLKIQSDEGWEKNAPEYYALGGLTINTTAVLNTGLIVAQPALHGTFFENMYYRYFDQAIGHPRGPHFVQAAIGYELQTKNMYAVLPNEYNAIWFFYSKAPMEFEEYQQRNFFLNFGGNFQLDRIPALKESQICLTPPAH